VESAGNNEMKGTGKKVTLSSVKVYDLGRMSKKVVTVCLRYLLSKHLMDGLPEYKAFHIWYEFTDKNVINISINRGDKRS
jgi:hypothetical protein